MDHWTLVLVRSGQGLHQSIACSRKQDENAATPKLRRKLLADPSRQWKKRLKKANFCVMCLKHVDSCFNGSDEFECSPD